MWWGTHNLFHHWFWLLIVDSGLASSITPQKVSKQLLSDTFSYILWDKSRNLTPREKLVVSSELNRYFLYPERPTTVVLEAPYCRRCIQQITKPTTSQICLACLFCDYMHLPGLKQLAAINLMNVFTLLIFHLHLNSHTHPLTPPSLERGQKLLLGC